MKFENLPKNFVLSSDPQDVFYPKIYLSQALTFDMQRDELVQEQIPLMGCCASELYGLIRRDQLYVFDVATRKNLNCIIMRGAFKCCLFYQSTT